MTNETISVCVGCGCDDLHACLDTANGCGCHWLRVDREVGAGVCSCCPQYVKSWDGKDRSDLVATAIAGRTRRLMPFQFDLASIALCDAFIRFNQVTAHLEQRNDAIQDVQL